MSHVDNEYAKTYVVTYKELIFIFLVFVVVLFVLYPKDLLKEQILSEESNYDLSMLYLKNLIKQEPNNESLMLILAEQSLRSGKKDLTLRLLELLLRSKNQEHREKATLLSYDLKKDDYFFFKEEADQKKQKEVLRQLFLSIMKNKMYTEDDTDKWYSESLFLEEYKYMYIFLVKKLQTQPNDIDLLKQAYYVAVRLKNDKAALEYVSRLANVDGVDKEKWLEDKFYILMSNKYYAKAEEILRSQEDGSPEWKKKYAEFSFMKKSFMEASNKYMNLFKHSNSYSDKKEYFKKALNALEAGNYRRESINLSAKYENYFIADASMRKYLLKFYIRTDALNQAAKFSEKILDKGKR